MEYYPIGCRKVRWDKALSLYLKCFAVRDETWHAIVHIKRGKSLLECTPNGPAALRDEYGTLACPVMHLYDKRIKGDCIHVSI